MQPPPGTGTGELVMGRSGSERSRHRGSFRDPELSYRGLKAVPDSRRWAERRGDGSVFSEESGCGDGEQTAVGKTRVYPLPFALSTF